MVDFVAIWKRKAAKKPPKRREIDKGSKFQEAQTKSGSEQARTLFQKQGKYRPVHGYSPSV
jgi:hypothetical protein